MMDAAALTKVATEIVSYLEDITDPTVTGDAAKKAVLEIATKAYDAKIAQDTLIAMLQVSLNNMGNK